MNKELLNGLTKEQIAKVKACSSAEEVLALAKAEGLELTDEQLEAASGGDSCLYIDLGSEDKCPECGSTDVKLLAHQYLLCNKCLHRWSPSVTVNR